MSDWDDTAPRPEFDEGEGPNLSEPVAPHPVPPERPNRGWWRREASHPISGGGLFAPPAPPLLPMDMGPVPVDAPATPTSDQLAAAVHRLKHDIAMLETLIRPSAPPQSVSSDKPMKETANRPYVMSGRAVAVGVGITGALWAVIVGGCAVVTHSWPWPVAVILGLALLPIGVSGGIRRNA